MTVDQVRRLYHERSFQPFRIHLADSRSFDVTHPEIMAINEPGRTIVIVTGCASLRNYRFVARH